ncbi:MAG TPA: MBL fold metallo-hydrolase [Gammaproteobacteria bacterium]|nr:MBL fold metallo-hydrolase [Gammaproteobacteria bacterium]
MTLRFCALASGSRGNALLVEHDDTLIMIDCGLPLKVLGDRLAAAGRRFEDIDALLVTHEHGDHSRGIRPLVRRHGIPVWASPGTARSVDAIADFERLRCDRPLSIGSIEVQPFAVPHDAREPCQFVFRAQRRRLGLLTDTGHATPVIHRALASCDALAIEFNHDVGMLENGSYPESVKARVGSRFGHLSNDQAADFIDDVGHSALQWVMALHLSERNNTPGHVRSAVARVADHRCFDLHLASQDAASLWLEVDPC